MRPIAKAILSLALLLLLVPACGPQALLPSKAHLSDRDQPGAELGEIPPPVAQAVVLPPPKNSGKTELYSVVVNEVPVRELLFALARDAKLNVDIHPGISGLASMNAIEQTLPQILGRLCKQLELRYELNGPNLLITPDTPYLKSYVVDYVNISRDSTTTVNVATQISTTGSGGGGKSGGDNNSSTNISSTSNNRFWPTLVENIKDILRETDKVIPVEATAAAPPAESLAAKPAAGGATPTPAAPSHNNYREAASVIANPENGIINVRATSRQHESIQEFLTNIQNTARRQVLIEATVVEVQLSDQYQQGVDWQFLKNTQKGINLINLPQGPNPLGSGATPGGSYPGGIFGSGNPAAFLLNYANPDSGLGGKIDATVSLLESFGKVKVLSSPKISVLNNQSALLKVVDNKVYFTVAAEITAATATTARIVTYTTTINTVPVGFVMSVTPQIDASDTVTLNVRPTITRITSYVQDPSPTLAEAKVTSLVPEIQTREMESILKIHNGEVAIMGGLMQDTLNHKADGVPLLSGLPGVGDLFKYRNESNSKTELVIFLRPVVVSEASRERDEQQLRELLPGRNFFQTTPRGLLPEPGVLGEPPR